MSNLDPEVEADSPPGQGTAERAQAVLEYVVRHIVDDPGSIRVEAEERRRGIDLHLNVAPGDMGKVIGRGGRVIQSMRTVVRVAGAKDGVEVHVAIDD